MGNFVSSFFKPKSSTVTQEPMMEQWQLDSGKNLANWANQGLANYNPTANYNGQFTAGMTPQENQSMGLLQNYMNQPATGQMYGAAQGQVMDTLGGKYSNLQTNPFLQSMQRVNQTNLNDQLTEARRGQGARGGYFNSQALQEEGRLRGSSMDNINAIMQQIAQQERQNQMSAVGQAQNLDAYGNQARMGQIQAGQQYGQLPRMIEQADLEAQYNDFLRKQQGGSQYAQGAQSVFGTQIPYGSKQWTTAGPSSFEKTMGVVNQIAPYALAPFTGGASLLAAGGSNNNPLAAFMMMNQQQNRQGQGASVNPGTYQQNYLGSNNPLLQ